jgi:glycolate oxidase FAD binding subunit
MTLSPVSPDSLRSLEAALGSAGIQPWSSLDSPSQSAIAAAIQPGSSPSAVLSPSTVQELCAVVAEAHQQRQTLLPCGHCSKLTWGGLVHSADWVVSTDRLNQLIDHAVGDLTVTVEAGLGFSELQATLAQAGQFLALDPAFPDQATIGGIIATGDTGSLRQRYNSVRDMLLGISVVRADGQLAKAGGRVVKNVAGYDLMKLLTGSYGTLGILTQATFRVYPLPEASQTVVLSGDAGAIAQASQALLNSALTPASADLLSESVTGAVPGMATVPGYGLAIRFQSILPSVQGQVSRTIELGQALGLTCIPFEQSDDLALWQQLRDRMTIAPQPDGITCKIGVQPTRAIAVFQQMQAIVGSNWAGQVHAASGLGRLTVSEASPDVLASLRSLLQAHQGFLSILQAPTALKQRLDTWGSPGNALPLMRRIKHQFDPHALLSPHRFVGGI